MNQMMPVQPVESSAQTFQHAKGVTPEQAAYMRGEGTVIAGSVPISTSIYLNSSLFRHAFGLMALRRAKPDVPFTYDIPEMSRALADVTDHAEGARLIAAERKTNPLFDEWVRARKPVDFDLDSVEGCAPGTLATPSISS